MSETKPPTIENLILLECVVSALEGIRDKSIATQTSLNLFVSDFIQRKSTEYPNLNIKDLKEKILSEIIKKIQAEQVKNLGQNESTANEALTETEVQIGNSVIRRINQDYKDGRYGNSDIKKMFVDINIHLDHELHLQNLRVSNQKRVLLLMYIVFGWNEQNKGQYVGDPRMIENRRGAVAKRGQGWNQGPAPVTTDEFHKAIDDLKEEIAKDQNKRRSFFDSLFKFEIRVNAGVNVDSRGFGEAFFEFLKKLIFGF